MVGETLDEGFNTTEALVKLTVLLVVGDDSGWSAATHECERLFGMGLLAVANIGIAVFWA